MEKEERDLLLRDLCARLPYGVNMKTCHCKLTETLKTYMDINHLIDIGWLPYLRPLSSMTDSEKEYYYGLTEMKCTLGYAIDKVRFCLEHHLDMNNLIPKGLALEAPKNMYTHFGDMKVEITVEHKNVYNLKRP